MAPKIAETIPAKTLIEVAEVDLLMLAAAVDRDAQSRKNWMVYNHWHEVLRDYYPKKEA